MMSAKNTSTKMTIAKLTGAISTNTKMIKRQKASGKVIGVKMNGFLLQCYEYPPLDESLTMRDCC